GHPLSDAALAREEDDPHAAEFRSLSSPPRGGRWREAPAGPPPAKREGRERGPGGGNRYWAERFASTEGEARGPYLISSGISWAPTTISTTMLAATKPSLFRSEVKYGTRSSGIAGSVSSRTSRWPFVDRRAADRGASDISTARTAAWSPPTLAGPCGLA